MNPENNFTIDAIKETLKSPNKIRSCAINAVLILLAAFLLAVTIAAFKDLSDDPIGYSNVVTIMGEGQVTAVADIATFNFTVAETSESVEDAQKIATGKVNSILDKLKENGIEDKDIKTQSYNTNPRYEWRSNCPLTLERNCGGSNEIVGYEVSQSITVKIRETEKAGDLIALVGAGEVSYISGLQFSIDDEDALKAEAREAAINDAKAKAKVLAKQLGVDLDDIVSFSEDSDGYYPTYDAYGGEMRSLEAVAQSAPKIPTGENTISSRVYITFEIED